MISYGRQAIDDEDVEAVVRTLRGDWLTQGPAIEEFEESVAQYVGAKYAVAYSSGTSALHGAAAAAGLGPGDVLVTSPLTFMASANAARFVGAQPSLVDIERSTWNLDMNLVSPSAKAVVPVHFAGLPVDLQNRRKAGQIVIEDAAQGLMSSYKGRAVGTIGAFGCISFHENDEINEHIYIIMRQTDYNFEKAKEKLIEQP